MSNINIPTQVSPFVNRSQFPALGKIRVIYIDQTENVAYYWNNTTNNYIELGAAVAVNWGDITGTLADQTDLQNALNDKVDKVTGKGLSTNDYTTTEKDKLAGIEAGAQVNVNADWNATTGDAEILNKPTIPTQTSDLTNDGENGINPFITAVDIPGSLPPSGTAGGDLTGTYPNPTVHRIHGIDVQNGTPSADDVLVYGGSPAKWQHQHLNASQVDNDSSVTGTSVKLALEHLDSTKVPTTRTLTINGTTQDLSADRTFTVSTGITIGTTAITSGTVGRVLFEGTGNVVQESANLFWDNTASRLQVNGAYLLGSSLINANTTAFPLQVNFTNAASNVGAIWRNGSSTGYTSFRFYNNINDGARALEMGYSGSAFSGAIISGGIAGESGYITTTGAYPLQLGSNNLTRLILASTGNVLINTTTDAGYKLDVNGTARVQDNVTLSKNINGNLDLTLVNSTSGTSAKAQLALSTNAGTATIGKYSTTTSGYKIVSASDLYLYNPTSGDISILNDFATGKIKFSSGGASTAQVTLATTGNLLINTTTDIASSKLTIESTTQGVLFPRMTTTQKNAIASPTAGLMVFDSTLNKLCVRGASAWETITSL